MREISYLDLDLLIERADGGYRARVLASPVGQAGPVAFAVPFSDLELENFLLRIGRPRRNLRRIDVPQVATIKAFGGRLFDTLFRDELRVSLLSSLSRADSQNAGLRIRLRLSDSPELAELPWEYLYDQVRNRFLCLSGHTPLVRYLELPDPVHALLITPPLRVLVMIASPFDYPWLDVEQEWTKLHAALGELQQSGQVTIERLETASLRALQQRLRRADYHVFHFIGHGGFDPRAQDGVLVLQDQVGRSRLVSGQELGALLHDHRSLRLVVLNACEGARSDKTDPFGGTAQSLVQQGIPAVVAMQFEITDEAAITFAHVLYEAIADGYPLDAATGEARKAIYADGNLLEWGTPVLYLRAPDGRIFSLLRPDAGPGAETHAQREFEEHQRREADARAAEERERWAAEERERWAAEERERWAAEERERREADARAARAAEERGRQAAQERERQAAQERERQQRARQEAEQARAVEEHNLAAVHALAEALGTGNRAEVAAALSALRRFTHDEAQPVARAARDVLADWKRKERDRQAAEAERKPGNMLLPLTVLSRQAAEAERKSAKERERQAAEERERQEQARREVEDASSPRFGRWPKRSGRKIEPR